MRRTLVACCCSADEGDASWLARAAVRQQSVVVFLRGDAAGSAGDDPDIHGPADHGRHRQPQGEQTARK